MGVYIKSMKMPKNCRTCKLIDYDRGCYRCIVTTAPCDLNSKNENCPLVPVPPHGRLIAEADAVETAWMILRGLGYLKEENHKLEQTVREVFATAPTIEVEEHG